MRNLHTFESLPEVDSEGSSGLLMSLLPVLNIAEAYFLVRRDLKPKLQ